MPTNGPQSKALARRCRHNPSNSRWNAPYHALVLCVDEKSQIHALNRTQPVLPIGFGYAEGVTHVYVRNGTTTPVRHVSRQPRASRTANRGTGIRISLVFAVPKWLYP